MASNGAENSMNSNIGKENHPPPGNKNPTVSQNKSNSFCGFLLTKHLRNLFIEYIKNGRSKAPRFQELSELGSTFQDGAKIDRRSLQSKFKSWAKRMDINADGDLILSSNKKIIIPKEEFVPLIKQTHGNVNSEGEHIGIDEISRKLSAKYTWGRREFGMDLDIVASVVSKCPRPSCLTKLQRRFQPDFFAPPSKKLKSNERNDKAFASNKAMHGKDQKVKQGTGTSNRPTTNPCIFPAEFRTMHNNPSSSSGGSEGSKPLPMILPKIGDASAKFQALPPLPQKFQYQSKGLSRTPSTKNQKKISKTASSQTNQTHLKNAAIPLGPPPTGPTPTTETGMELACKPYSAWESSLQALYSQSNFKGTTSIGPNYEATSSMVFGQTKTTEGANITSGISVTGMAQIKWNVWTETKVTPPITSPYFPPSTNMATPCLPVPKITDFSVQQYPPPPPATEARKDQKAIKEKVKPSKAKKSAKNDSSKPAPVPGSIPLKTSSEDQVPKAIKDQKKTPETQEQSSGKTSNSAGSKPDGTKVTKKKKPKKCKSQQGNIYDIAMQPDKLMISLVEQAYSMRSTYKRIISGQIEVSNISHLLSQLDYCLNNVKRVKMLVAPLEDTE